MAPFLRAILLVVGGILMGACPRSCEADVASLPEALDDGGSGTEAPLGVVSPGEGSGTEAPPEVVSSGEGSGLGESGDDSSGLAASPHSGSEVAPIPAAFHEATLESLHGRWTLDAELTERTLPIEERYRVGQEMPQVEGTTMSFGPEFEFSVTMPRSSAPQPGSFHVVEHSGAGFVLGVALAHAGPPPLQMRVEVLDSGRVLRVAQVERSVMPLMLRREGAEGM